MSYRLLCLDAGFTLLSPRRTLAEALSGVLAQDGHQITEDEMRAAWEEADRWFWDEYHRPGNDTWTDDDRISDYWRRYHGVMLGRLGVEAHREMLDRILASQFAAEPADVAKHRHRQRLGIEPARHRCRPGAGSLPRLRPALGRGGRREAQSRLLPAGSRRGGSAPRGGAHGG